MQFPKHRQWFQLGCCACGQGVCAALSPHSWAPGADALCEGGAGFLAQVHGINVLFCAQGLRHHILVTHCHSAQLHQVRTAHMDPELGLLLWVWRGRILGIASHCSRAAMDGVLGRNYSL